MGLCQTVPMSDMSDLPNFPQRPWYRRQNRTRVALIAIGALIGTVAWCLSDADPAQDISVSATVASSGAKIGSPYTIETVISNSGPRSAQIHLQAALFMKASACMEAGQRLPRSFSLPMTLSISPNGSKTIAMQFDPISSPCGGTMGVEFFADGKMDLERFSFNRKLDTHAIQLL